MSDHNISNHSCIYTDTTRFWLIRHAIVNERDRAFLYGIKDVPICQDSLRKQKASYQALAQKLPVTPYWFTTSLSRTRDTALQIQQAGYGFQTLRTEDAFLEQNLGTWQGLSHQEIEQHRKFPAHPFWPLAATEIPPQGESMHHVYQRVSTNLETLDHKYQNNNLIIVSHGGTIRAALAYALQIPIESALSFSIYNLSLTVLEKKQGNWHIITVNNCS